MKNNIDYKFTTHQGLFIHILSKGLTYIGESRYKDFYMVVQKHTTRKQYMNIIYSLQQCKIRLSEVRKEREWCSSDCKILDEVGEEHLPELTEDKEVEIIEDLVRKKLYKKPIQKILDEVGITEDDGYKVGGSPTDKNPNILISKLFMMSGKITKMGEYKGGYVGAVEVSKNHHNKKEVCVLNINKTVPVEDGKTLTVTEEKHLPDLTSSILSYCDDLNFHWNGTKRMFNGSTWVHLNLIEFGKRLNKEWAVTPETPENKKRFQILRDNFRGDVRTQISIIRGSSWYKYEVDDNRKGKKKKDKYLEGGYFSDFYQSGDDFWVCYSSVYNLISSSKVVWCSVPTLYYRVSSYLPHKTSPIDYKSVIRTISEQIDWEKPSFCEKDDGYHITVERLLEYTSLPKSPSECSEGKRWKRDMKDKIERILDFCTNTQPENILNHWWYKGKGRDEFSSFDEWITSTVVLDIDVDKFRDKTDYQPQKPVPKREIREMGGSNNKDVPQLKNRDGGGSLKDEFLKIITERLNKEYEERERMMKEIEMMNKGMGN